MIAEMEPRIHRCCFTGHRPEKLKRSGQAICKDLEREILRSVGDGFTTFITGMAKGIDINAGEIVLQLRNEGLPIHLICVVPYRGFERAWSSEWQHRYNMVLAGADEIHYICPRYSRGCFQMRNRWLVDHSARVIAVFNDCPSGTKNTIDYAHRKGIPVVQIEG